MCDVLRACSCRFLPGSFDKGLALETQPLPRALLACSVSKDATDRFKAGDIVKDAAAIVGGGGGGRPDFAQAGGTDASKLAEAVARVYALVV